MLSRTVASGMRLRAASLAQPGSARLFSAKGSDVFDKEANKEQMAQVTRQMEDAILKEKDVHESQKVPKMDSAWNTTTNVQQKMPEDAALQQNKTREMNAIFDEQVQLAKHGTLHGQENNSPYKGDTDGNLPSGTKAGDYAGNKSGEQKTLTRTTSNIMEGATQSLKGMMSSNPSTSGDASVMDKMKTTMESASKSVKEMMGTNPSTTGEAGAMGMVKDTTKSVSEGLKQTIGTASASVMGMGQNVKETVLNATGSVKNMGQGMKDTVQGLGEGVKHTLQDTAESVKGLGQGTAETVAEAGAAMTDLRQGMRDGMHDASFSGLGDGTRQTMNDASKNMKGFTKELRDVTKKSMEDLTEMAKGVMTSSHPLGEVPKEPFEDKHKHQDQGAGMDADANKKKPVSSSDRKTNASIF